MNATTPLFGAFLNWRGPVWFPMITYLFKPKRYHSYAGDPIKIWNTLQAVKKPTKHFKKLVLRLAKEWLLIFWRRMNMEIETVHAFTQKKHMPVKILKI